MGLRALRIIPRHDFSIAEIDCLEDELYGYNRSMVGQADGRALGFSAIGRDGVQVGAVAGYSWAGMAEIRQLWVRQSDRNRGFGRALIGAAVAEAGARGCRLVWTMSYDFQAPGLYERCGFERVAELKDWPPGHTHIVLRFGLPAPGTGSV